MKKHRILTSFHGSQNGIDRHHFEAGTVAHLSDHLAPIAVRAGWAEEEKAIPEAPANKMREKAPENKGRKAEE